VGEVTVPFVDLTAQYRAIEGEVRVAVDGMLAGGAYVLGSAVAAFEEEFAAYLGVRHAVGVANGTDALTLALRAAGIGAGDEVIVPANTFVATAEAVVHAGARPVLVDVSPGAYLVDAGGLAERITARSRAVIPVHLYGQPAEMEPILDLADARGLLVIEDAAQAHGAVYRGRKVGSFGRAASFSFYPAKNLGAYGDAGAVATDDDVVADAVRRLRDHGGLQKYQHDVIGYTSRLDAVQAAVLRTKLQYLDRWNARRREHARLYDRLLAGIPGVAVPVQLLEATHVFHLYVITVDPQRRDALRQDLRDHGIGTGIHYPLPVHLTPAFRFLGYSAGDFPVAVRASQSVLSLPMYPELSAGQIECVAGHIREFMQARMPKDEGGE